MGGWKTWAAGVGMIMLGVGQCVMALSGEANSDLQGGIATVMAGLAILGIGHKIEKSS